MTKQEDRMGPLYTPMNRRRFLKGVGLGTAGAFTAGGLLTLLEAGPLAQGARGATVNLSLVGTDGYATMPGREDDPLYIFGFRRVNNNIPISTLIPTYRGHVSMSAPHLDFRQEDEIKITLTNLGLAQRPDLTDSHTIHWHGFDLPSPFNDGVPEVSVAAPVGKQLQYFFQPHREGTYMYHCHFEDVEHVQMGMTGMVFVRSLQDTNTALRTSAGTARPAPNNVPFQGFAYNDGDGSTGYDRHFAILLNEIWSNFHDGDRDIQESIPTDYRPQWFTMNGRAYPQTILPNDDPSLPDALRIATENTTLGGLDHSQPNSSLIQANPGERILLRLANLGYEQHSMQLPGIPMRVVGQDASLLRNGTADLAYDTTSVYIGPGEARDVLFTAPLYEASRPSGSDGVGNYNVYLFKNRDWRKLSNLGTSEPGGMMTEVRVYAGAPLPAQTTVSQTHV